MSKIAVRMFAWLLVGTLTVVSVFAYPAPQASPQTVRVGGDIKPPVKTKNTLPTYPPVAKATHIEGVVMLDVTIGTDGKVKDVKVLRSVKGLDDAAVAAVRRWEYKPTTVNGQPVQVIVTVPMVFTLE
jgi:periplasmic protein TonB